MPRKPIINPTKPSLVIVSIFIIFPIRAENNGIAPTIIAVRAVPILGMAMENPINCKHTVVAPTTANGLIPIEKSNLRLVSNAISSSTELAINDLIQTAPTQPKPSTTRSTNKNDNPQRILRTENFASTSTLTPTGYIR